MPDLLEITHEDIERLNDIQLTKLLLRLLHLEADKFNIPSSCVSGSLEINVPDGGEDARIKWESGITSTNWLPGRFTLFQCKATSIARKDCKKEICIDDGQTVSLKPMVEEVLENEGSYVLFYNYSCNTRMEQDRIAGFREGIRSAGKSYADSASIRIYDSNKLAIWVNQYIPAIIEVREFVGRNIPVGIQTWSQWERYKENLLEYEVDDVLKSHIDQLRRHFAAPRRVARIVGLSGLGKTRLALETFRPPQNSQEDRYQYIISSQVVYIDASSTNQCLSGIITNWRNQKLKGIIVIDNCELELHKKLVREVEHPESLLSILTLDYTPERLQADYPIIELKPASDEVIRKLITQAYQGLPSEDISRIVEFAQGFPLMAVLIANARLNEQTSIGNLEDDELARKLLWGRNREDEDSLKVIEACAIFEHIGFYDEVSEQRKFVAEKVCRMDSDKFYEIAQKFILNGILDKRGRYVRVIPRPLAIRLAANWWKKCSPERAKQLVLEDMPSGMSEALCDQMSKLHFLKEAQELTKELCGERAPFGQAEVLNSEEGSRLFRSLVDVDPQTTVNALTNAFKGSSIEDLLKVGPGRRNLVWALEKLCFWQDTFISAARFLLDLAVAENETWGNNATNQFLQLFHVFLSGTQAPPIMRIEIIEYALNIGKLEYRTIAVEALGHVIRGHHFSRMVGAEIQGSRAPQDEWKPNTWEEVFDYWRKGLDYLTQIATGSDELANLAQVEIAEGIRSLVQYGLIDELDHSLKLVGDKLNYLWPGALEAIQDVIEYDGPKIPEIGQKRLMEWLELFKPRTFADKLKLVISIPSWDNVKDENGKYIDISEIEAIEFAKACIQKMPELYEHINIVFSGEQRKGYIFGYTIGQLIENHRIFIDKCLCALKEVTNPNAIVLAGYLFSIKDKYQTIVFETLERIAQDDELLIHLIDVTTLIKPEKRDLERLLLLVDNEKIHIKYLRSFSYGRVLSHLSLQVVIWFSDNILKYGPEGYLVALSILYMYCYNEEQKYTLCTDQLKKIVSAPGLISHLHSYSNMDSHQWGTTVLKLLGNSEHDIIFAKTLQTT